MSTKIYTVDELISIIVPIIRKYKAEQAILFGSYARNDATAASDIDLYVVGGDEFEPTDIFSIADELYDAAGKNVDVYEQREINNRSNFFESIMREGVRIA